MLRGVLGDLGTWSELSWDNVVSTGLGDASGDGPGKRCIPSVVVISSFKMTAGSVGNLFRLLSGVGCEEEDDEVAVRSSALLVDVTVVSITDVVIMELEATAATEDVMEELDMEEMTVLVEEVELL